MSKYLSIKGHQASAFHSVRLFIQGWEKWGINISDTIKRQIQILEKEEWVPKKITRLNKLQQVKATQFEAIESKWKAMVHYMSTVTPEEFRQHLATVASNMNGHASVAVSSFNEMVIIGNKSNQELKEILLGTRAFASLLRYTGMRSITGANVTLEDFTEQPDGSVLLQRIEKKCGSIRNVEKLVYVRIVPHKDPEQCTLVHLAEYFWLVRNNPTCRLHPFARGFKRKQGQDTVNFAKLLQRRYIAMMHAVAIACGLPDGLGEKRLHIFRVICENVLGGLGATSRDRQEYIGWKHDTQAQNYSSLKHRAFNSNAPYLMSGRQNKEDKAHPMWGLFDKVVPGAATMSYWDRVNNLASAAGFTHSSDTVVDHTFRNELERHIINENKAQQISDPKLLLKRVRELEAQLQEAKQKIARVELENHGVSAASSPRQQLEALVLRLKGKKHEEDFPELCAGHLDEIARLIDVGAGKHSSFVLERSTATGKDLIRILLLAVIASKKPNRGTYHHWFSFVNGERKNMAALRRIDTASWTSFKESMRS